MGLLKSMNSAGYLKAGFFGFPKSGKTYTATELAIGTRKFFDLKGPIAFFDTEGGSSYVRDRVKKQTGMDLIGVKSHAFKDLLTVAGEAQKEGVSVLLVDSVSHIWRELQESYLANLNERQERFKKPRFDKLEFQHWATLKRMWADWTNFFLNANMHIVICGRAAWEYDFEKNENTGKKELVKTNTKMSTEKEFGFEPSLLVEMEREEIYDQKNDRKRTVHCATVIGDRFGVIDGHTANDPNFDFFLPHLKQLVPADHTAIDTTLKSADHIDDHGDDEYAARRKERTIVLEEIEAEMTKRWPGQTKEDKTTKIRVLEEAFGTASWEKVSKVIDMGTLRAGLAQIREVPAPEISVTQ